MKNQKVELGDEVRDPATGVQGIAVSRTEYLTGCARIGIQPPFLPKEGRLPDCFGADEPMVEIVKAKRVVRKPAVEEDPGGPRALTPTKR